MVQSRNKDSLNHDGSIENEKEAVDSKGSMKVNAIEFRIK
jgi:hypothetical protein